MEKLRFYRQTGMLDPTLNAMSRKGFTVKRTAFGFYLFSSCPPGEYTYQTVWTFGMKRKERRQMIDRLSRSGIVRYRKGFSGSAFGERDFLTPIKIGCRKRRLWGGSDPYSFRGASFLR